MHRKQIGHKSQAEIGQNWKQGPQKDKILEPGHGRPITCGHLKDGLLLTGSSDHSLNIYSMDSGVLRKNLYNKQYGHSEWVTDCIILDDKRVISAGMDSIICVWEKGYNRCLNMVGHKGSISKVMSDQHICISGGYDSNLMVWDINSNRDNLMASMSGVHQSPIIDFDWHNSLVSTVDKNGQLVLWDINKTQSIYSKQVHQNSGSKVSLFTDYHHHNLVVSVGQNDGNLVLVDMRSHNVVFKQQVHKSGVNDVIFTPNNLIVTTSSDKTSKIIDVNDHFGIRTIIKQGQMGICLAQAFDVIVIGCNDGNLLFYSIDSPKCMYGFGAMSQGIVRKILVNQQQDSLVALGDDNSPLLLQFY